MPPSLLTKHHCTPQARGGKKGSEIGFLCRCCHTAIHCVYTNKTLEREFPTVELLRAAPEIQGHIKWIRNRPVTERTSFTERKRRL